MAAADRLRESAATVTSALLFAAVAVLRTRFAG